MKIKNPLIYLVAGARFELKSFFYFHQKRVNTKGNFNSALKKIHVYQAANIY